jgi:hypothetical protein
LGNGPALQVLHLRGLLQIGPGRSLRTEKRFDIERHSRFQARFFTRTEHAVNALIDGGPSAGSISGPSTLMIVLCDWPFISLDRCELSAPRCPHRARGVDLAKHCSTITAHDLH